MRGLLNYFLTAFQNDSPFEKRKASYLLYIIFSALAYVLLVLLSQSYFKQGPWYLIGNVLALNGIILSLFLFKLKRVEAAGHVMICAGLLMVVIHNVVRDFFGVDPIMRFHIYINMVALFGIYLLIIAFFRDKKVVYIYGVIFELIILAHTLVIYHHLKDMPRMGLYVWQHFITAFTGIITAAVICTWLLSYIDTLLLENTENANRIKEHSEKLESIVEERTRALRISNQHLQEFAYIVSHDLKEPLRTISGFVTLIKKELKKQNFTDEQVEEYISYVLRGTVQMEELINDILAYSKLNVVEKRSVEVDLHDTVSEVLDLCKRAIEESGAEIAVEPLALVRGEKHLLIQLYQNLVVNAIKYRSEDRPLKLTVGCINDGNFIRCYVKDNGIGIPLKYFDTIFQAFKRLHSKVRYEGTGIGLAICKKIVELHGGTIWVESREGHGSTFWFTLPKS